MKDQFCRNTTGTQQPAKHSIRLKAVSNPLHQNSFNRCSGPEPPFRLPTAKPPATPQRRLLPTMKNAPTTPKSPGSENRTSKVASVRVKTAGSDRMPINSNPLTLYRPSRSDPGDTTGA